MCVPCILSGGDVKMWYNSNRTMYGRLKKKTSGQAAKKLTARQQWNQDNFSFLQSHLVIHAEHSQLSKVMTPALPVDLEGEDEGGEDNDATSVASSQLPISSQAAPTHPHDRRPPGPAASGSGWKLDEAMMKLVDKITVCCAGACQTPLRLLPVDECGLVLH